MICVMLERVQLHNNVIGIQTIAYALIGLNVLNNNKQLIAIIVVHVFGKVEFVTNYNAVIFMRQHVHIT